MKHEATPRFWQLYRALPASLQELADKNFELLKNNPQHPSLHLKKVGRFWSVRIGLGCRALAVKEGSTMAWF